MGMYARTERLKEGEMPVAQQDNIAVSDETALRRKLISIFILLRAGRV